MFQHVQNSGLPSLAYPTANHEGRETVVIIVKATFAILADGQLKLADDQLPIQMADAFRGDPTRTSLLADSDLAIYKGGTDIIVHGEAFAPHEGVAGEVFAGVRVGDVEKVVRVVGDRRWERRLGIGSYRPSPPEPFARMPLTYERAYGGYDPQVQDPEPPQYDERNPAGRGFCLKGTPTPDLPLPNLEDPHEPFASPKQRPEPCGFGPVSRGWPSRRRFAGTYDDHWQQTRMPFLPVDFNYQFFQSASAGLVSPTHLRGDEAVRLANLTPQGKLDFTLPGLCMGISVRWRRRYERGLAPLDTVVLEPSEQRLSLVWRKSLVCTRSIDELGTVHTFTVSMRAVHEVLGETAFQPQGVPCWQSR